MLAIYTSPAILPYTILVAGLVAAWAGVSASALVLGKRALAMGPPALAGVALFVISVLCMNFWSLFIVPDTEPESVKAQALETMVAVYQVGLLIDSFFYVFFMYLFFHIRPEWTAVFLFMAVWFFCMATLSDMRADAKVWELFQIWVIATMALFCLWSLEEADRMGRLMWSLLMIAEWTTLISEFDCQILHGRYGVREQGSACEQVYGVNSTWIVLAPILAAWFYILFRWFTSRPKP